MSNQEIVEIILKAIDNASGPSKKVEEQMDKIGNVAQKANQKMANASKISEQQINKVSHEIKDVISLTDSVGSKGASQFKKYNDSMQECVVAFNRLDSETQDMLRYLSQMSDEGREAFIGMSTKAQEAVSKFNEMQNATTGWGNTLDITRTKMQLMGTNTDSLKGKIQVLGSSITTHLGNKWDTVKTKVTGLGNHIKTNLSNALSTVSSKIQSLGNAFSGLGGIISSVFGGIGLAAITDMTIGASISRDRIFNLSHALMGANQSAEEFKTSSESLWNMMDEGTNKSLVGLDQLSQAMSVIAMSTSASTDQLKALEPVVLDIGQRAILMGKDGSEAIGLMQAAGKGLNGEFEMLRENLGITKQDLLDAGWSGAAEDIEGYADALNECLKQSGDVSDMMDTTYGKLTRLKKYWGLAGRSIGDEFKPYLDQALDSLVKFFDADNDGALDERGKKWMQYGYGVMAVGSSFAAAAPGINSVFTAVDNGMSVIKGTGEIIRNVGSALGIMSSAEELAGAAAGASAAGHAAAATAEEMEAGAAGAAAVSTWALVWPVLAVIAAIAGIALVVYEAGKAFGWWSDVGTMIDAITNGVQRLWNAFINNPDVQDLLKGISEGFSWIASQIGPAVQGVLEFLGVSTEGNFDIVRVIIDGVGGAFHLLANAVRGAIPYLQGAWNVLSWMLSSAVGIGQGIYNALKPIVCILLGCSPGIVPALQTTQEVFFSVWDAIAGFIGGIVESIVSAIQPILDILSGIANFIITSFLYAWQTMVMVFNIVSVAVNRIISIFSLFLSGQINLQTALSMIWNTVSSMFVAVFSTILSRVTSFATNMVNKALAMGKQFVNNIINNIKQLPGKVYSQLVAVVSKITSAGSQWVSKAKSKAQEVVNGAYNTLSSLPGKISSALSGVVNAIVAPFRDAYNQAKQYWDDLVSMANNVPTFGGDDLFIAPDSYNAGVDLSQPTIINTGGAYGGEITGELTLVHDLHNLPDGVSAGEVAEIVLATANSDEFGKVVASNSGFQNMDLKVKNTFTSRVNRANGV